MKHTTLDMALVSSSLLHFAFTTLSFKSPTVKPLKPTLHQSTQHQNLAKNSHSCPSLHSNDLPARSPYRQSFAAHAGCRASCLPQHLAARAAYHLHITAKTNLAIPASTNPAISPSRKAPSSKKPPPPPYRPWSLYEKKNSRVGLCR